MKLRTTVALFACSMLAIACGKDKDNHAAVARAIQNQEASPTGSELKPSGEKAYEDKVTSVDVKLMGDKAGDDAALAKALAASADLSRDINAARSIDHVIETKKDTIDLYAGDKIVAILEMKDGKWAVSQSANSFSPKMIVATQAGMPAVLQNLAFTFETCVTEQPTPDQKGAEQGKGKGEVKQPVVTCTQVQAVVTLERRVEQQQQQQQPVPLPKPTPDKGSGMGTPAPAPAPAPTPAPVAL